MDADDVVTMDDNEVVVELEEKWQELGISTPSTGCGL
ncbi:hypothetical protein C5167_039234 [Papaver somniferum]|uniref:Uncharacterized protein n=1 Tax=Papaver somniferum TaxID=3469 RepID=A0A4Y7IFT6_PAPSO|nr:hypothetical protein C5167_039234 [Papaver somniferum]